MSQNRKCLLLEIALELCIEYFLKPQKNIPYWNAWQELKERKEKKEEDILKVFNKFEMT